jgi:rhodanese-related sulfurtransferase
MVQRIGRKEVQGLAAAGAPLVEVLPPPEYRDLHLPGAVNVPLKRLADEAPERFRMDRAVVVYCYDHQ